MVNIYVVWDRNSKTFRSYLPGRRKPSIRFEKVSDSDLRVIVFNASVLPALRYGNGLRRSNNLLGHSRRIRKMPSEGEPASTVAAPVTNFRTKGWSHLMDPLHYMRKSKRRWAVHFTSTKRRPMESTSYRISSKKRWQAAGKPADKVGRLILEGTRSVLYYYHSSRCKSLEIVRNAEVFASTTPADEPSEFQGK